MRTRDDVLKEVKEKLDGKPAELAAQLVQFAFLELLLDIRELLFQMSGRIERERPI